MLRTASHNFGPGMTFGSTPNHEIPSFGKLDAIQIIGEGIILILENPTMQGQVNMHFDDGRVIAIKSDGGSGLTSERIR